MKISGYLTISMRAPTVAVFCYCIFYFDVDYMHIMQDYVHNKAPFTFHYDDDDVGDGDKSVIEMDFAADRTKKCAFS